MQTLQIRSLTSTTKVQPEAKLFLRLFVLATAATLLMSIFLAAHAQTTTIYSGTYYPVYPAPNYYPSSNYYYVPPQPGYNYPIGSAGGAPTGPAVPAFVTTLPSNGYYAPYPNYQDSSPPAYYSYPANSYPYPVWVTQTGIYYSGPTGGGGTIYSNSTQTSSNNGISYGRHGWTFNLGNNTSQSSSSTTVTTH
ncbi:MAG: hypothetical protein ABI210_12815 [Abditibacteriaceae bacterium]